MVCIYIYIEIYIYIYYIQYTDLLNGLYTNVHITGAQPNVAFPVTSDVHLFRSATNDLLQLHLGQPI